MAGEGIAEDVKPEISNASPSARLPKVFDDPMVRLSLLTAKNMRALHVSGYYTQALTCLIVEWDDLTFMIFGLR